MAKVLGPRKTLKNSQNDADRLYVKTHLAFILIIWFNVWLNLCLGFRAQAQTFKLESETSDGESAQYVPRPSPSNLKANKARRASESASRVQKNVTNPSLIPNLGGTEAGVTAVGFSNQYYYTPGETRNRPGNASPTGSTYRTSDQFSNGTNSSGFTSALGILNLFGQATILGQRVAPRAGQQPMFYGECKWCQPRNPSSGSSGSGGSGGIGGEVAGGDGSNGGSAGSGAVTGGAVEDEAVLATHNPALIRQLVKSESLDAFGDLDGEAQQARINDVIASLNQFGGLVLRNTEEYTQMCPNFENLNPNQRKAFMVFLYSEIFKQTTNYNNEARTEVSIDGVKTARLGLCQIEFNEVKSLYENIYDRDFTTTRQEFESDSFAFNPLKNISICSAMIFNRTENPSGGERPLTQMFPDVNFSPIQSSLRSLSFCASGAGAVATQ